MALSALNGGRVGIGACSVGLAQQAFDYALSYGHKRQQFGRPIVSFQGLQFLIADLATEIEAARLMIYRAATLMDEGESGVIEAAMGKTIRHRYGYARNDRSRSDTWRIRLHEVLPR